MDIGASPSAGDIKWVRINHHVDLSIDGLGTIFLPPGNNTDYLIFMAKL